MSREHGDARRLDVCACLIANHLDGYEMTPAWLQANAPDVVPPSGDEINEAIATMRDVGAGAR